MANIHVIHAGASVLGANLIEVNTRSSYNLGHATPIEVLPQLLLSDTGTHILGVHAKGCFKQLRRTRANDPMLKDTEKNVRASFTRLRRALEEIQSFLCGEGRGKMVSFVCVDGVLRAFQRRGEVGMLPRDVTDRFAQE
jgi:hypothetical protein